jgi:hypothetical protein
VTHFASGRALLAAHFPQFFQKSEKNRRKPVTPEGSRGLNIMENNWRVSTPRSFWRREAETTHKMAEITRRE